MTPEELIAGMPAARRGAVRRLDALIRATVPALDVHVRDGLLGYGSYRYRYNSGRAGEGSRIAVGAAARHVALHVVAMIGPEEYLMEAWAERLGGRVGRSTLRCSSLEALDLEALRELLREAERLDPPGLLAA